VKTKRSRSIKMDFPQLSFPIPLSTSRFDLALQAHSTERNAQTGNDRLGGER
jgi:hypothetical protein